MATKNTHNTGTTHGNKKVFEGTLTRAQKAHLQSDGLASKKLSDLKVEHAEIREKSNGILSKIGLDLWVLESFSFRNKLFNFEMRRHEGEKNKFVTSKAKAMLKKLGATKKQIEACYDVKPDNVTECKIIDPTTIKS